MTEFVFGGCFGLLKVFIDNVGGDVNFGILDGDVLDDAGKLNIVDLSGVVGAQHVLFSF